MKANYLEYQWWDKTRMKDLGEGMKHETWLGVARGIRITLFYLNLAKKIHNIIIVINNT